MNHTSNTLDRMFTLGEAKGIFNELYMESGEKTRLHLKCWIYYVQGRAEAGKRALSFEAWRDRTSTVDYITMINGFLIDCTDFGGQKQAIRHLMTA